MAFRPGGSGSYLNVPLASGGSALSTLTTWTIGAWARADASMTNLNLIVCPEFTSSDVGFALGISYSSSGLSPAGRWFTGAYDDSGSDWDFAIDTVSHEIGQWQHVAGTYDGTAFNFYKNGVFVSTGASVGFGVASDDIRIGMRTSNTSDYFNGLIQDVFVYQGVLTREEIRRIYLGVSPLVTRPTQLKAYWPLRGLESNVAKDYSATGAHASRVGTLQSFDNGKFSQFGAVDPTYLLFRPPLMGAAPIGQILSA